MIQIDKIEDIRTICTLLIGIATLSGSALCIAYITNDWIALISVSIITFIGCLAIELIFNSFERKIKKYMKDHAEDISLDCSLL